VDKCPECGIEMVISKGLLRTRSYRGEPNYLIPASLEFPVCPNCGAEWMTSSQIEILSEALEKQREERKQNPRVHTYKEVILTGLRMAEVEDIMDS